MIGRIIKEAREKVGISAEKLGEMTYLSRQAIFYYETGKRKIPIDMLMKFSRILNLNIMIAKGDLIIMENNNKTINETVTTIEDIKERFVKQFKYTNNILLNEMFGITTDMFEEEYDADVIWRHFSTDLDIMHIDEDSFTVDDLKKLFENPDNYGYWTFEIETKDEAFEFSVNFKIKNKEVFTSYINDYIDSEYFNLEDSLKENFDIAGVVDEILRTITYCQNSVTSHLIIGDITVTDIIY